MYPASSPSTRSSYLDAAGLSATDSMLATLRDRSAGRVQEGVAAGRHVGGRTVDLHDLVPAHGTSHQGDVPAPDVKRLGDSAQRRLGRLPVNRPCGDGHHERLAVPSADSGARRARLNADGYPHAPAETGAFAAPAGTGTCISSLGAAGSQRGSGSWAALITTTGHGERRRQARITGPAGRRAPGVSLTVPRTSMSAPSQRSSRTRAARPSTVWVRTSTPGIRPGSTARHMTSMSTSSGPPCAGTA